MSCFKSYFLSPNRTFPHQLSVSLSWILSVILPSTIHVVPTQSPFKLLPIHSDPSETWWTLWNLASYPHCWPLLPTAVTEPCTLHSVLACCRFDYGYYLHVCLSCLTVSSTGVLCLLFSGSTESLSPGITDRQQYTYVPKDCVGCFHASMDVIRYMTVYQPCPWVICKQFDGLECPRKEVIHIFSVRFIYLQKEGNDKGKSRNQ